MRKTFRPHFTAGIGIVGAGLIAVPPMPPPALHAQVPAVQLAGSDAADSPLDDEVALVMGPSGFPVPPPSYLDAANDLYLHLPDESVVPLTTTEQLYPVTGPNTLGLDPSVALGVETLNNAIQQQLADGNHVDVFGYSQSSIVGSEVMTKLAAAGVSPSDVHFTLVGDPVNPNGGFLPRFDVDYPLGGEPSIPSYNISLSGETPTDLYPTDIYTLEYDGFADFPRYPINLLSDLNAYLGILFEHTRYVNLTPDQLSDAIVLATVGDTTFHMIPAEYLPLLEPLLLFGSAGKVLYDLLEPATEVLVNLGYGNIDHGWDTGPPTEPTAFGLFPTNIDFDEVWTALINGIQQGITDAIDDLQSPSTGVAPAPFEQLLDVANTFGLIPSDDPTLLQLTDAVSTLANGNVPVQADSFLDAFTGSLSYISGVGQELADTAYALALTLPEYEANLFVDGLLDGDLVEAIGDPIAANTALAPFAVAFGALAPIGEAVTTTISEFASLMPSFADTGGLGGLLEDGMGDMFAGSLAGGDVGGVAADAANDALSFLGF